MSALNRLTEPGNPAVTICRASDSMTSFYILGDASGQGFGSGLWDHEGLRCDSANWLTQWKNETSNWKEGTNLTFSVEELPEEHKLDNGGLFILKNNQVFEGCFYKGAF